MRFFQRHLIPIFWATVLEVQAQFFNVSLACTSFIRFGAGVLIWIHQTTNIVNERRRYEQNIVDMM